MKFFLKILLLILSLAIVVIFVAAVYSIFITGKKSFQTDLIIPIFFIITGTFSFFFHFKTVKFYKANADFKKLETKLNTFWIVNAVFGVSLVLISFYFIYIFYFRFAALGAEQAIGIALTVAIPFLLGIWLLLDEALLYKKIKKSKSEIRIDSIDDIKGNQEE